MDEQTEQALVVAQGNEITEHHIYARLAQSVKGEHNREVLERISADELRHYEFWKTHTKRDVKPSALKVWRHTLISRVFGLTFGIKLMERGESGAQVNYRGLAETIPGAEDIAKEEELHENELVNMLDEDRLKYIGAVVRGLNDALVELTGALAGFTFAFGKPRVVAMAGLITGISASFSMAGSEYLATKSEPGELSPGKAAFYTGLAYVFTVLFLVAPYLVLSNLYACLGLMIVAALLIICFFNFYIAVAKELSFWARFLEMAGISLGIAALSFGIGLAIRQVLGVEV